MPRVPRVSSSLVLCLTLLLGCDLGEDWKWPANLLIRVNYTDRDGFVELDYWSLVDAPCDRVYEALVDVEHYPEFIPGVQRVQLLEKTERAKTVQIAQDVIGRQANAKVQWMFDPAKREIQFKTLASDLTYNDGYYKFEESPDKTRCLVKVLFMVKQSQGLSLGALGQATRESYLAAARGVKKRAVTLAAERRPDEAAR
jgi:ribosome-associated toxin RatA of RatAB toxin-antitoxin module